MAGKQGFMSGDSRTGNGTRRFETAEEHRSSEDIRQDIGRTRHEMDSTLERLGEQLRPKRLFESFLHALGSTGDGTTASDYAQIAGNIGKRAIRQAERHPIPALLFGAGLAWLLYEEFGKSDRADEDEPRRAPRRRRAYDSRYEFYEYDEYDYDQDARVSYSAMAAVDPECYDWDEARARPAGDAAFQEPGVGEKISETVSDAAHSAKEAVQSLASKAKDAGEKTADMAASAVSGAGRAARRAGRMARGAGRDVGRAGRRSVRSTAHGARTAMRQTRRIAADAAHRAEEFGAAIGHQAERAYWRGREGFSDAVENYPLAVGAGFAAMGVLAGLALPSTQYEDEWMGEASDRVKDMARQKGEEVLERGRQTVETAKETLQQEAKAQGLMPANIQEKAKHVLSEAVGAAKEAVRHELSADGLKHKAMHVAERVGEEVKAEATRHKEEMIDTAKKEMDEAMPKPPAEKTPSGQCEC